MISFSHNFNISAFFIVGETVKKSGKNKIKKKGLFSQETIMQSCMVRNYMNKAILIWANEIICFSSFLKLAFCLFAVYITGQTSVQSFDSNNLVRKHDQQGEFLQNNELYLI
jgi:hypothetical protein